MPIQVHYSYSKDQVVATSEEPFKEQESDTEESPGEDCIEGSSQLSEEDQRYSDGCDLPEAKQHNICGIEDDLLLQSRPTDTTVVESKGVSHSQEVWDDDGDEEELFHDVGHTNSLNALALPDVLTKGGRSAVEVVQLLRFSSSFGQRPKGVRRIKSYTGISSRGNYRFQRRFSLGAIPEGQMVTSYSDEDPSTTHLLDDQFFTYSYTATHKEGSGGEGDKQNDSLDFSDDDVFEDEEEQAQPDSWHDECSAQLSKSDTTLLKRSQLSRPQRLSLQGAVDSTELHPTSTGSLKIVNFAWDPETNSVESKITTKEITLPERKRSQTPVSDIRSPRSCSPSPGGQTSPQPPTSCLSLTELKSPQAPMAYRAPSPSGRTSPKPSSGQSPPESSLRSPHPSSPSGRNSPQLLTLPTSQCRNSPTEPQVHLPKALNMHMMPKAHLLIVHAYCNLLIILYAS